MQWYALRFFFLLLLRSTMQRHTHKRRKKQTHACPARIHLRSNNNINKVEIENSALIVRTLKMKLPPKQIHIHIWFHDKYDTEFYEIVFSTHYASALVVWCNQMFVWCENSGRIKAMYLHLLTVYAKFHIEVSERARVRTRMGTGEISLMRRI